MAPSTTQQFSNRDRRRLKLCSVLILLTTVTVMVLFQGVVSHERDLAHQPHDDFPARVVNAQSVLRQLKGLVESGTFGQLRPTKAKLLENTNALQLALNRITKSSSAKDYLRGLPIRIGVERLHSQLEQLRTTIETAEIIHFASLLTIVQDATVQLDLLATDTDLFFARRRAETTAKLDTLRLTLFGTLGALVLSISGLVILLYRAFASSDRAYRELIKAEHELRMSEENYRSLYHASPMALMTIDQQGNILSANQHAAKQIGRNTDNLEQQSLYLLYHADDREEISRVVRQCFDQAESVHHWELRKLRGNGNVFWVRETVRALTDASGREIALVVSEDITEARELSDELAYQATHDSLTGLANRRAFEGALSELISRAQVDQSQHVLCYIDLDQFKVVNDTCGHSAGDMLLTRLASILQPNIRKADLFARLGGDEFGLLLHDCSLRQAERIATELHQAVTEFRFAWEDKVFALGASIGVVQVGNGSMAPSQILSMADAACYAAKDSGRNRIHISQANDPDIAIRRGEMQWVSRINQAIDQNNLCLEYQPISACSDGVIPRNVRYELLVRMLDEDGKTIPPGAFLSAVERYNLTARLDRWVVDAALNWLTANPRHCMGLDMCSINLSAQTLTNPGFLEFLSDRLMQREIDPGKICFEITETATIANLDVATHFIEHIKSLNCKFALDDFGSGFSSLGYLKNLPVDYLKIDGLFVRNILKDPVDRAMVRCITEVAKAVGKQTIAEYVESSATLATLNKLQVDYAQGYAISPPRPLDELNDERSAGSKASISQTFSDNFASIA